MSQAPGAAGAIEIVKKELDLPAPPAIMAAAAGSSYATEFGLGYEQFGRLRQPQGAPGGFAPDSCKKIAPAPSPRFLQVPAYEQGPSRGAFGSLATQDFLQPLERGANGNVAAKVPAPVANGDIPLQLSSRSERNEQMVLDSSPAKESCSSRMHLQMQYGFIDHPHPLFPKNGLEANHHGAVGVSRHWQQGHVSSANKRPRSAQSEGDDNDSEERKKIHRGEAASREDINSRSIDVKSNTSRSKHSATEQRRRSKINDRLRSTHFVFQMLRDLLPHGDQKRDKASFLLEVIEYVQSLQERVKKFEASEKGRYQERLKPVPWDVKSSTSLKEVPDSSRDKCALLEDGKSRSFGATTSRAMGRQVGQAPSRPAMSPLASTSAPAVENLDATNTREKTGERSSESQRQANDASRQSTPVETATAQQQQGSSNELPIKQGLISLSTAYSQGLLEALTSALHSSGLDLSKANISVQIELGKPQEKKASLCSQL
ncbi:hypothetical protein SELMODRAFT_451477 [Selaginella moellendorffii]|uniref:Uncharacterized protein BIM-1 n=1 Tax=Selaginella moellendorffii TaxID=88036 RepID=D8RF73_SELML|nr:hypothetical protein SELMODRAFT_451477 [Selaginella moellendorffii]